jgi:hypothetical protein
VIIIASDLAVNKRTAFSRRSSSFGARHNRHFSRCLHMSNAGRMTCERAIGTIVTTLNTRRTELFACCLEKAETLACTLLVSATSMSRRVVDVINYMTMRGVAPTTC